MKTTPLQVLESPDWIVRRALFHAAAKGRGTSDRFENEQRRSEGMAKAFGRH